MPVFENQNRNNIAGRQILNLFKTHLPIIRHLHTHNLPFPVEQHRSIRVLKQGDRQYRPPKKKENNKKHYGNQNRSPGNIAPFYNCVHSSLLLPPKIHTILKIRITRLLNLSYNFWLLPTKRKFSASLLHPDSSPGQCNSTFPKPAM